MALNSRNFAIASAVIGSKPLVQLADNVSHIVGLFTAYLAPFNAASLHSGDVHFDKFVLDDTFFPKKSIINWGWPTGYDCPSGVWGFMAIDFANYNNSNIQPVTANMVKDILALTQSFDLTLASAGTQNVILDLFVSNAYGDQATQILEIDLALHPSTQFKTGFADTFTSIGVFTSQSTGKAWKVSFDSASSPQIVAVYPNDGGDYLSGSIDLKEFFAWLITQGVLTGYEYYNGHAVGVEPIQGSGNLVVNAFEVSYAPKPITPATAFAVTGPTTAAVGSTAQTYTLKALGSLASNATITPSDGSGGTFSPSSITLAAGQGAVATFTYSPSSGGNKTLSFSNNAQLTNPTLGIAVTAAPTYHLDFVNNSYLDASRSINSNSFTTFLTGTGSSFVRTGAGGYDMAMTQLFANNVARITSAGLLYEPSSTNLFLQSDGLGGYVGSGTGASTTANGAASVLGTNTALLLTEDTSNGAHQSLTGSQYAAGPTTNPYILSVFAKRVTGTRNPGLFCFNAYYDSNINGGFDIIGGGAGINLGGANWSNKFGGVTLGMPNGFARIYEGASYVLGNSQVNTFVQLIQSDGNTSYVGDGSSLALACAQVEIGATSGYFATHPSSYIPNTDTALTRGADTLTLSIPSAVHSLTITFDDESTQTITGVSGNYVLPAATLNRPQIKSIAGF